MSNQAAVLKEEKTNLTIEERPIPKPGPSDVVVKNHALATNPVDWKMQKFGYFLEKYPAILGSDVSGVIDAVGSDVKHFKKGDRVTGFADGLLSKDPQNGAFQEYSLVKDCALAKIPDSMSFEEGSILPMSVATSAVGIFLSMEIPRPPATHQGNFLVWGASSSVGTAAVQIAAALGYMVYGVCSPRHSAMVKKLGAHLTFDYNSSSIVKDVTQAMKASNQQAVAAYDAISENGSAPKCAEILEAFGGGKLCLTLPYPEDARIPPGVEISQTFAARICIDKEFGHWLFNEWLAKSLEDKTFVPSPAIENIDGGIQSVQRALNIHAKGLSGKKLVITL
ncbi:MAG: hypothetical protein ASARMPREDX12_008886 [Alectoria sarmentosa]|nr:MAG: hypothetical protein ASARMPREDX12_008886 [Alectoria sarmentosa]